MDGTWTIGELAERAAAALAAEGAAQVSGRVRDLPNARLIRWYTTIGLVDPPLARRGRNALYGHRHLLQLVAVKRRQAEGRSIAEIQLELAAAPDETLARIADLPATDLPTSPALPAAPAPHRTATPSTDHRPSHHRPHSGSPVATGGTDEADTAAASNEAAAATGEAEDPTPPADPPGAAPLAGGTRPPDSGAAPPNGEASSPDRRGAEAGDAFWKTRPDVSHKPATVAAEYGRPLPPVVQGVQLASGVTLLLDGAVLAEDDLAAIEAAARPLLEVLHRRGLFSPAESPAFPPDAHFRRSP